MGLLDPWRQAREEIIASRPVYQPRSVGGPYTAYVGNTQSGQVDAVTPQQATQPQYNHQLVAAADSGFDGTDSPVEAAEPSAETYGDWSAGLPSGSYVAPDDTSVGAPTIGVQSYGNAPAQNYAEAGEPHSYSHLGSVSPDSFAVEHASTGYTDGALHYDESGRAYAVGSDAPQGLFDQMSSHLGFPTAGNTYKGGLYDQNGQRTDHPDYKSDKAARTAASWAARAFPAGAVWSPMIAYSRVGDLSKVGPYTQDAYGNFRFDAKGPMGTMMSPVGVMVTPDNYQWGGPAMNDHMGAFGLGTVGNTGKSATPAMFDDVGYKGGAHGYGVGVKADGTVGSLTAFDVEDPDGMQEAAAANMAATDNMWAFDPGGGDGGGDGKVICGELNRQGLMPDDIYEGDLEYQRLHVDDATKAGYLLWARPLVKLMRKSKTITHLVKPFALPWAEEMAFRSRGIGKGNKIGAAYLYTFAPVCKLLGKLNNPRGENVEST